MYCWYLRHTYLQNELREPGKLTVCGEKVDLGRDRGAGVHLRLARRPHRAVAGGLRVAPGIVKGKARFVLGASGHIAGVINPPAARASAATGSTTSSPATAKEWLDWATEAARQLVARLGGLAEAPRRQAGRRTQVATAIASHKAIEPAPGRYVKAKA